MGTKLMILWIFFLFSVLLAIYLVIFNRKKNTKTEDGNFSEIASITETSDANISTEYVAEMKEENPRFEDGAAEFQDNASDMINERLDESEQSSEESVSSESVDMLVRINIEANEGYKYSGYELLQALLSLSLRHGKMDIFHRYENKNGSGPILFSVISMVEPGSFDLNNMGAFFTPGLSLFMQLDKVKDPLVVFDLMIRTAQRLVDDLGGVVLDDRGVDLSDEKMKLWRQRIRHFEKKHQVNDLFDE